MSLTKNISQFVDNTFFDLGRQFRWSYLPPLMVYVAAGVSGLTGIVGVFFIKDYLNLSAAFLAGLGFWVGIPWALKMPLGHLVDLIWSKKKLSRFCWSWDYCVERNYYVWPHCSYRNNGICT